MVAFFLKIKRFFSSSKGVISLVSWCKRISIFGELDGLFSSFYAFLFQDLGKYF